QMPQSTSVDVQVTPVKDAISYTERSSSTAMFTKMVKQLRVPGASAEISGFDAGDYFWNVIATDAGKKTSEVSETFKFTIVAQGRTQEMMLEIGGTQLHGRVVEVFGKTEP